MKIVLRYSKIFRFFLLSVSFAILQAASAQDQTTAQKIRIDPAAAMGGTVSQYIDSVRFITLESTLISTFGNIDQLEITDKFFIILDQETNAILIFNKKGQFHAKIEGKELSSKHKLYIFYFDKKTNLIETRLGVTKNFFNIDGKLVTKIITKEMKYDRAGLGDNYIAYYNQNRSRTFPKDSIAYELLVFKEGKLAYKYLPYMINFRAIEGSDMFNSSHNDFYPDYDAYDTTLFYLPSDSYSIYRLTQSTLQTAYQFIFPVQNSLPPNFTTDSSFDGKRLSYVLNNSNKIISRISNFYKYDQSIFFRANLTTYIYNMQSQNLINMGKIISDASSYFLPVTDAEIGLGNSQMINFDGKSFYTSYSSLTLFTQMEATRNKNPKYPPELTKYFSNSKNRKGNPVLVQIHFKSVL